MNKIDRYKILVRYAINNGIATSQSDLGIKLGYNNASAFSQLVNCRSKEPKEFSKRLLVLIPDLNIEWLEEGVGSMLKVDATATSKDEINQTGTYNNVHGDNNVNADSTINALIERIKEKDEQISRLITIIENKL